MGQIPPPPPPPPPPHPPSRVKDPNFILGLTYAPGDVSSRKCQKACETYGETPEIRNPNKHMGFGKLNKHWRVVQWVESLGETPMTSFHTWHCMCEGVSQDSGYGHEEYHLMHDM